MLLNTDSGQSLGSKKNLARNPSFNPNDHEMHLIVNASATAQEGLTCTMQSPTQTNPVEKESETGGVSHFQAGPIDQLKHTMNELAE